MSNLKVLGDEFPANCLLKQRFNVEACDLDVPSFVPMKRVV